MFTLGGAAGEVQEAVRSLARVAVATLDLSGHDGVHPRFGVLDVVPFVPLVPIGHGQPDLGPALVARDAFATWAGGALGLPCFLYGPLAGGGVRSLPEVRRGAFRELGPDAGPATPHPTAGASAVGARPLLVAYNLWLAGADVAVARTVAAALRGPAVRALGLDLGHGVQVSCNLVDPFTVGPAEVYDRVSELLRETRASGESLGGNGEGAREREGAGNGEGARDREDTAGGGNAIIEHAELVGLLPEAVLERTPPQRWAELDLAPDRTIEARLARPTPRVP